jgi:glycosyltransferase involved in cell wall biosynthesis
MHTIVSDEPEVRSGRASAKSPGVVVVHAGARDSYQVAVAMAEAGMLEALVTDLFWAAGNPWTQKIASMLPSGIRNMLAHRSEVRLPSARVKCCSVTGAAALAVDKFPRVPLQIRSRMMRHGDKVLGTTAGKIARRKGCNLVSYSYYGHAAFSRFGGDGILFQLHPHPASMRTILLKELLRYPECAASLQQEWELALCEGDYQRLVREPSMARHLIAASSFTRSTLVEHGVPYGAVAVIPYGVDSRKFKPCPHRSHNNSKLQLLFVGRINQRKGIRDLVEAMRLVGSERVELTICGRVVDDLSIFRQFGDRIRILPDVSDDRLIAAYQSADLFVFPSLAEGFGQVLLEALASGLPILSTARTAAPDLIEGDRQGFIVEPGKPEELAARIEWALANRSQLRQMGHEARRVAEHFTWQRFRSNLAATILSMTADGETTPVDAKVFSHAV